MKWFRKEERLGDFNRAKKLQNSLDRNSRGKIMQNEILKVDELIDHLRIMLINSPQLMEKLISFCQWIEIFNKGLPRGRNIIFYKREYDNIGFTIEAEITNPKKPNFLVIKFDNTDVDYKYFHLDIYLGKDGYPPLGNAIYPRKSNKAQTRWIIDKNTYMNIDTEKWEDIVKLAYEKRFMRK